ncbi:MAG: hypothetical protein DCC55_30590 [Chloroflexi bacterium]|nr:MAG: hypothetical protein DCC55_30590 [Chloroflexota bacterium]
MPATNEPPANLPRKIAEVVIKLKPFQSLEYDPETGLVSIVTELLVPGDEVDKIAEILARCDEDEKVTVKRYADSYKVILSRHIQL